jgi:hypothetical protein
MATLTEVFPCFFLSCKVNATVKRAQTGHGPHSTYFLCCSMYFCVVLCIFCVVLCVFVLFYVFLCCSMYFCVVLCIVVCRSLFVYICVLYYCHRVATHLQLNILYHVISYHIKWLRCDKLWEMESLWASRRDPNGLKKKFTVIL